MRTLLRIDSSSRTKDSHSRQLADVVERHWRLANPNGKVINRDLAIFKIPHILNETIVGFYTPENARTNSLKIALSVSDELIEELYEADDLLISSPLYNLNIPSNLKAYFDQVTRVGKTFGMDDKGNYYGMLKGKNAYLALVKGGNYKGTPLEEYDFQEPYLKAILNHMGIDMQHIFSLEGTATTNGLQKKLEHLHEQIQATF